MTPTEHCFAKLREMCLKHDPSLAIALDLVLEDMAAEASAPSATGPETGQISTLDAPDPQGESTHEGLSVRARALRGDLEDLGSPPVHPSEFLWGIRIIEDDTLPPGVVELRQDGRIVASITNLADPTEAIREPNDLLAEHTRKVLGHVDQEIEQFLTTPPVPKKDEWEIPPNARELPLPERAALCARLSRGGMSHRTISKATGIPSGSICQLIKEHQNRGKTFTPPSKPTPEPPKEERPLPGYVADSHVRKVFDEALARCNGAPRGADVVRILRMGMERPGAPTKMADELELPATTVATVLNRYKPLLKAWGAFVSPAARTLFGHIVQDEVGRE